MAETPVAAGGRMKRASILILVTLVMAGFSANPDAVRAQQNPDAAAPSVQADEGAKAEAPNANPLPEPGTQEIKLLQLVRYGGIVGYIIIILSVVALSLIVEYAFTIRRSKLAPPEQVGKIKELIGAGQLENIKRLHEEKETFLSYVVTAGISELSLGYAAMIKAMEDASEAAGAKLARKIEHLNIIANVAPMLGLLGTVIGMIRVFNRISNLTGAIEPKILAGGIFEALMTTCMGLIVAIPTLYFFAIFRNRVDEFSGDATLVAQDLVTSLKKEGREA